MIWYEVVQTLRAHDRMMKTPPHILSVGFLCLLAACRLHDVDTFDHPDVAIPATYHQSWDGNHMIGPWWEEFHDPALNHAMAIAVVENFEVKQAWHRLDQALAQAKIAGADRWPQVDVQGGASRIEIGGDTAGRIVGGQFTTSNVTERYLVSTGLTYEIDLWKRIASHTDAVWLEYEATKKDVEETLLVLTGAITKAWFTIQEQHALLALLAEQLDANRTYVELTELRFSLGEGSALDVFQQREHVAATEAEVPVVESQLRVAMNQLAVLLGAPPGQSRSLLPNQGLPELPPFPRLSAPASLLTLRPDLHAAQIRLQAADHEVASAIADRLPRLSLSLSYEFNALDTAQLIQQHVGSLAGNFILPMVDGGRRRQEVVRRQAVVQEQLDAFGQTFLIALREVEDALVRERYQVELLSRIDRQRQLAEAELQESRVRYVNGLSNYLQVLLALRNVHSIQRRVISERRALLVIRSELYRAVGGGGTWLSSLTPPDGRVPSIRTQESP